LNPQVPAGAADVVGETLPVDGRRAEPKDGMDSTTPSRGLYDEVRRLALALLHREGVRGVVLLDRAGGLVVQQGDELIGDVEGLAARFWKLARATSGLGREPIDRTPNWFVRDERHGAWAAPVGRGLTLMVFLAPDACAGSAWRLGEDTVLALRMLIEGPPTPSGDRDSDDRGFNRE